MEFRPRKVQDPIALLLEVAISLVARDDLLFGAFVVVVAVEFDHNGTVVIGHRVDVRRPDDKISPIVPPIDRREPELRVQFQGLFRVQNRIEGMPPQREDRLDRALALARPSQDVSSGQFRDQLAHRLTDLRQVVEN